MKEAGFPRIPGFDLVAHLGYGCGGVAVCSSHFLARMVENNALVLLRVSNQRGHDRFPVDVSAVGRLEHPNILRIMAVGQSEDFWYEALEHVEAHTLATTLCQGPLSVSSAICMTRDLALALQYARDRGMIYRQLTPASVLLTDKNLPKLHPADFVASAARMEDAMFLGDPAFLPPEWLTYKSLEMTPASDVYRVGALMYTMLAGHPPFFGDNPFVVLEQVANTPPPSIRRLNLTVPRDLEAVCLKCLEKQPGRRYTTPGQLAEAIAR